MALQKDYLVKIYDNTGATIQKVLPVDTVRGEPTFKETMNKGLGELKIDLAVPWDDFDEGGYVDFLNVVEVYAHDSNNPTGRRIYKGFISQYMPYIRNKSDQGVQLTALGLWSYLVRSYYKSGGNFTFNKTDDPSAIAKDIIDHFNTVYSGTLITYAGGNVDTTGTTANIDFTDMKWSKALERALSVCPDGWWMKVDEDGELWLKDKPASADHTFIIGHNVSKIEANKDSEEVVNEAIVRYDGGATTRTNSGSQTTFGVVSKIISDTDIKNATTAEARGDKKVNDDGDEKISTKALINNNYDLESIRVGQTCKFRNFNKASSFFSSNMQIVEVNYKGDEVIVTLEEHSANLIVELGKLVS